MSLDQSANFVKIAVQQGYGPSDTAIQLAAGQGARLPNPANGQFNLVWWNATDYADPADDPNVEIVRATALSGDVLAVARAQEGTPATQKQNLSKIYKMMLGLTAKMIADLSKGPAVYTVTTAQGTLADSGDHQNFAISGLPVTSVYGLYLADGRRYSATLFSATGNSLVLGSPDPDAAAIGMELVYS